VVTWDGVTPADVVRALREHDRLGPERFFAEHGFARTLTYDLIWEGRAYPPKAILGTAYTSWRPQSVLPQVISRVARPVPCACSES
jgi:hypothetical protein